MKDHPLLLTTPMVQALLEGRKHRDIRPITKQNSVIAEGGKWERLCWDGSEVYREFDYLSFSPIDLKAPLPWVDDSFGMDCLHVPYNWADQMQISKVYPRVEVGDSFWVKEAYWEQSGDSYYKADWTDSILPVNMVFDKGKWKPSIFMPRWASRLLLPVKAIRAKRLQDITEGEAVAEGCQLKYHLSPKPRDYFVKFWDTLYPPKKSSYSWASNCWVWIYEF